MHRGNKIPNISVNIGILHTFKDQTHALGLAFKIPNTSIFFCPT